MKVKESKKVVASSSSSSSDSSDDEPAVKVTAKAPAAKVATPKSSQEPAGKGEKAPKAAPAAKGKDAIPKSVPASKFPKRTSTSSSDSSSSSDEEPATKKAKPQPANTNNKTNNVSQPVNSTPKHQPIVSQSPKRDPPAAVTTNATPVKRAPGSHQPAPVPSLPASKPAVVTAAGDEQYKRTDTKTAVTHSFGSSCPHCGHDVEVRLKLS